MIISQINKAEMKKNELKYNNSPIEKQFEEVLEDIESNANTYKIIILAFLLLMLFVNAYPQQLSQTKTFDKVFSVNTATTMDINNKYGKIDLLNWDKDSVKIEVLVTARSNDKEKISKLLAGVDVQFSRTEYYVTAKTILGGNRTGILSDLQELTDAFVATESQVRIDYAIHAPVYVNLYITNKYGDVFAGDVKGNFFLFLSNGDFKVNNLSANSEIDLKFGHGNVNSLNTAKITVSYSELNVKKANQLTLIGKSGIITIEDVNVLKTQSKRDKFTINKIAYLYGETYFSELSVNKLVTEMSIDMKYGSIKILNTPRDFRSFNINSQYTDIELLVDRQANFDAEFTLRDVQFSFPDEWTKLNKSENDNKQLKYTGFVGKANSANKLRIVGEASNISLK